MLSEKTCRLVPLALRTMTGAPAIAMCPAISTATAVTRVMPASKPVITPFARSFVTAKEKETKKEEDEDEEVDEEDEVEDEAKDKKTKKGKKEEPTVPFLQETEKVTGAAQKLEFQAETRKLLDIVSRSLYTDKEVFIRELISNASDALEKLRHNQVTGVGIADPEQKLEILIATDEKNRTITLQDFGIGMSKDELIENLGNIGHSGSLDFIQKVNSSKEIIGQFGVGFYSTFMVASRVKVYSRSATPGSKGYLWTSDGFGTYDISEAEGVSRGTKIIVELKEDCKEFAQPEEIESIIQKYSNFVGFDIQLNGKKVNTVKALWTMSKNEITEDDHKQFYQFISRAYDAPRYTLHFATDSPLSIRSLFYVPETHFEKYGMQRMDPGVSLFSRKVLIQNKVKGLLPEWLRFVKGVVDSEELPLNLSREHLQDSTLVQKLGNILTKRLLRFLDEESKKDPEKYTKFFNEFSSFFKEGAVTDLKFKEDVAKLLRFESSKENEGKLISFDDYLGRMTQDQKEVYYLVAPSRALAESSPYMEVFKERGIEVLYMYSGVDDFVMSNLGDYKGKKLISAEAAKLDPVSKTDAGKLTTEQFNELAAWMKETLSSKVASVREAHRLTNTPAIIVEHEAASMRRMMRMADPSRANAQLPKQQLELNAAHPMIKKLYSVHKTNTKLATSIAEQIFDNALIAAGLLDDSRAMLPRIAQLLEFVMEAAITHPTPESAPATEAKPEAK